MPLKTQDLSVVHDAALNPWTGVGYTALGSFGLMAVGGTLATLGGNVFGPTTASGQASLVAGNTLVFFYPFGASVGYLYGQEPVRGLWVGLGGLAAVVAGYLVGTVAFHNGITGLVVGALPAGAAYSIWSLFDVYHTIADKVPASTRADLPAR